MLQSVLYYTGDYLRQYWLTPYLGYLLNHHHDLPANSEVLLLKLEYFDNLFSTRTQTSRKELSYLLLDENASITPNLDISDYLTSNKGTGFQHYWFQKLEYILWKNWEEERTEKYYNYRISSKNSVEHIYPQHPENRIQHPEIDSNYLHAFGNLVLLSVSQNSEYSNKSVKVKREMFKEKKETYDTLKSFYIFKHENWTEKEIEEHQNLMIEKILKHYHHA